MCFSDFFEEIKWSIPVKLNRADPFWLYSDTAHGSFSDMIDLYMAILMSFLLNIIIASVASMYPAHLCGMNWVSLKLRQESVNFSVTLAVCIGTGS